VTDLIRRLLEALEERVWVFEDDGREWNTCSGCGAVHPVSQQRDLLHKPNCPIDRLLKEASRHTISWVLLGTGYPLEGGSAATKAAFDVLAPIGVASRLPGFEWGHETTPTPMEVWKLADELTTVVIRSFLPK